MRNRQFRLAARPEGLPKPGDWNFITEEIRPLEDGEILVQNIYLSMDPAMRGWMNVARSYVPPVNIGEVMRAGAIGKVIATKNDKYTEGEYISGNFGVQEYCITNGKGTGKVDIRLAPLTTFLGVLGMTGLTAYFGLLSVGQPVTGETVVVSGGAGAVGSVVGQIAKIKGCRVVGIAGGEHKCRFMLEELGFDAVVDHQKGNLRSQLKAATPDGIDVYFDNVGGETLNTVLTMLNLKARVVICGAISQYNHPKDVTGPSNYLSLLVNRARMEGFIVFDYAAEYSRAIREMAGWMNEGHLRHFEHIIEGIEQFPDALLQLFEGDKIGKLLLKI